MSIELIQTLALSFLLGFSVSFIVSALYTFISGERKKSSAQKEADRIIQRAKSQSTKMERESRNKIKDYEQKIRQGVEGQIKFEKKKLKEALLDAEKNKEKLERSFKQKERNLEDQVRSLENQEKDLEKMKDVLKGLEKSVKVQADDYQRKIESVASLTKEEAKKELKASLEDEVHAEVSERLSQIEEKAREESDKKAKMILATAISRYASEVSTEKTVSILSLTGEDLKGKIIGREGRNIRALESACGVDFIIDETPGSMVISSFDPIRREIARISLERLIEDGRIHPARIEELVSKVKQDFDQVIKENGEKACFDLEAHEVHPNVQYLVGTLKYRFSHMNNLYDQSLEMGFIAGMIASEVEVDPKMARRVGLLHAVGRAISHTVEGSYSEVGSDYLKKHGESKSICDSVLCHTGNIPAKSVLDHIGQVAFNLVESRPGVKNPSMEKHVKRLKDLESVANSFDGVFKTFAIQSGKEIRVLVDSGKITEDQSQILVRDIARKVERELSYSGKIKISVIRETRMIEHAR